MGNSKIVDMQVYTKEVLTKRTIFFHLRDQDSKSIKGVPLCMHMLYNTHTALYIAPVCLV